jgi:hypothetical protein
MAGLINWKKVAIPGANPDSAHVYVGIDSVDGLLYLKNSAGTVTKYPTLADVLVYINDLQAQIDVWQEYITTADLTSTSNVTLTNVPELGFSAVAGKSYYLEYTVRFRSNTATTGLVVTLNTSTTAVGTVAAMVNMPVAVDGTAALFSGSISTLGDLVIGPSVEVINTDYICNIKGVFECTTSGTFIPQFRSEINANTVTFRKGSIALIRTF